MLASNVTIREPLPLALHARERNARLRIAVFVDTFPVHSETFVIRQVADLVAAGDEVTVIAGKWGERDCPHDAYRESGLERLVRPMRTGLDTPWRKAACVLRFLVRASCVPARWPALRCALQATRCGSRASLLDIAAAMQRPASSRHLGEHDVVIAHFGPAGVRAMHLQKAGLLGGALMIVFHGADMSHRALLGRHRRGYAELFAHAARLLPVSRLWRERLIEWGAPVGKIAVLHMGVALDRMEPIDPRRPMRDPLRVVSVARLTEKKGLRHAIQAVGIAQPGVEYAIAGSGPLEGELRAFAAQLPEGRQVTFLGPHSQQDVFDLIARADVFLLPSITSDSGDMEGIPVALMEAMALGMLVIATRHSGIPELVEHGVSGLLVAEGDSRAIAQLLDDIRAQRLPVERMRAAARRVIEQRFDNRKLTRRLREICASCAARR